MSETSTSADTIIHSLPPELSNKIAAGEVIQRPASVVKELQDNAIDSGADRIQILIEQAGRTRIQVTDNGCGMSKADLPLCIRRHATSKIQTVEDLFRIRTMGFRGEAMASIASVSHMTLKSKRAEDPNGWEMEIRGGEEGEIRPAAMDDGTTVTVKNLFYNVPARRQFLKTDVTELRHILRTVQYGALAFPDIAFEVISDGERIYTLPPQSLADRIALIFGAPYKASLVPFEQETSVLKIRGFVSDPKLAKKSRGEQFLFVNGRPFQHRYLTHVILSLYDSWTRGNEYPFFALFFEVDPSTIDVNVHPAKMEIKFEDERSVIQLARSIVNKALNQHFHVPEMPDQRDEFLSDSGFERFQGGFGERGPQKDRSLGYPMPSRINRSSYTPGRDFGDELYGLKEQTSSAPEYSFPSERRETEPEERTSRSYWQLHGTYILTQTRTGFCMIDQYLAHKRIIFERAMSATESELPSTQQLLFAQTLELSASDHHLLKELLPVIQRMGFSIQLLSGNTAMITGVPADIEIGNEQEVLISMLNQYQELGEKINLEARDRLAIAFASKAAIPRGKLLSEQEMESLVDQLFACEQPYLDPLKKPTIVYLSLNEIQSRFR